MKSPILTLSLILTTFKAFCQLEYTHMLTDTNTFLTDGKVYLNNNLKQHYMLGYVQYNTISYFHSNRTATLACLDYNNNFIYKKRYFFGDLSLPVNIGHNYLNSLEDKDKNELVAVGQHSQIASYIGPALFVTFNKTTGDPNVIKSYQVDTTGHNLSNDVFYNIKLFDGSYYVVGSSKGSTENEKLLVAKLDLNGNPIWFNQYDLYNNFANERKTIGYDLMVFDDNIYVIGKSYGTTSTSHVPYHNLGLLVHLDTTGVIQNSYLYDLIENTEFFTCTQFPESKTKLVVGGYVEYYLDKYLYFVGMINLINGTFVWENVYDCPWSNAHRMACNEIEYNPFTAEITSIGYMDGPYPNNPTASPEIFILKQDLSGNAITSYREVLNNQDYGIAIEFEGTKHYLYGHSNSFGSSFENLYIHTSTDFEESCNIIEETPIEHAINLNIMQTNHITSSNLFVKDLDWFRINLDDFIHCDQTQMNFNQSPFESYNINIENKQFEHDEYKLFKKITLYEITGKLIGTYESITLKELDGNLSSGIYIAILNSENNTIATKIIK